MNHQEAVALCRYVKAACPQQAFDEYTPDAWADLLGDLRFVDCKDAAKAITQRQPFCAPAEIRAEVRRIRNARITRAEHTFSPPPSVDYGRWLGEMRRRAGDGEFEGEEPRALPERPVTRVIERAFRPVEPNTPDEASRSRAREAIDEHARNEEEDEHG